MANITVRGIEALRPTEKEYKVTVDRGLYLRVAVDGVKTWHVRYVVNAKQVQARLPRPYGASGEEGYMSLAQALAENARIQSLAREGVDFQVQRAAAERASKEAAEAAEAAQIPFEQLFETWMTDGVSRKDGNAEIRRTFTRDVLPTIGAKPVREVSDSDILHLLRAVGRKRGAARTAERLLSELRQLFRWAIKRQPWRALLNHHGNPADLVELKQVVPQGWKPGIRDRVLSPKEIRELQDRFAEMDASYEDSRDKRVADRPLQLETRLALWICLGTASVPDLMRFSLAAMLCHCSGPLDCISDDRWRLHVPADLPHEALLAQPRSG